MGVPCDSVSMYIAVSNGWDGNAGWTDQAGEYVVHIKGQVNSGGKICRWDEVHVQIAMH